MIKSISLLLCISFLTACTQSVEIEEPTQPSSVPSTAMWVGGIDGGVFVVLNDTDQGYYGEIYHQNGDIAYKGPFTASTEDVPKASELSKIDFTGWDGERLYIQEKFSLKSND